MHHARGMWTPPAAASVAKGGCKSMAQLRVFIFLENI